MNDPLKIVFVGDSITDGGWHSDADKIGSGYVYRIHKSLNSPRPRLSIVNRGESGDRAVDLHRRWDRDVVAEAPDILSILVGINDVWRRYDANEATSVDAFAETYTSLVDRARESGIDSIVLCEPFLVPVSEEQRSWRVDDLASKITAIHDVASRYDLHVIPLDTAFTKLALDQGPFAAVDDGVHPTPAGHQLIADMWVDWARNQRLIRG